MPRSARNFRATGADCSRVRRKSIAASGKARQKYLTPIPSDTEATRTPAAIILYSLWVNLIGIGFFPGAGSPTDESARIACSDAFQVGIVQSEPYATRFAITHAAEPFE